MVTNAAKTVYQQIRQQAAKTIVPGGEPCGQNPAYRPARPRRTSPPASEELDRAVQRHEASSELAAPRFDDGADVVRVHVDQSSATMLSRTLTGCLANLDRSC
jgi:hypothetical protein